MIKIVPFLLLFLFSTLSGVTETFQDKFQKRKYNKNNGTKNFSGNWQEYEPYDNNNDPKNGYIKIKNNKLYFSYIWAETISRELDLSGASAVTLTFELVTNNLHGDIQDIQMRNSSDTWITVLSIDDATAIGTKTYIVAPQFIHNNSAIRFIARDDWESNDNVYIDDLTFSATYIDTDGDGVFDNVDVDDDNDGILDVDEVSIQTDIYSNGDGGGTHTHRYGFTERSSITIDIKKINQAFNVEINNITLLNNSNILDTVDTSGRSQLIFATSSTDGNVVDNPSSENSNGLPRIRIFVDNLGTVSIYGTRKTDSTLLELMKTKDGATYNTFTPSDESKEITVRNIDDSGTETLSAKNSISTSLDDDGDGVINSLDLDSDNDGIPDNVEAQVTNGFALSDDPIIVRGDGSNDKYPATGLSPIDTDNDGVLDNFDHDSDADLITDCIEGVDIGAKDCSVPSVRTNGLPDWAGGDGYGYPSGNINNPNPDNGYSQLLDELLNNNEAAYRELLCGDVTVHLTAMQWKVISFSCDTGSNGIDDLLKDSLGTYGDNDDWVMYEQLDADYTGNRNSDMRLMNAGDPVIPGKGYWIISATDKDAHVKSLTGMDKTTVSDKSIYALDPTVNTSVFESVKLYPLPNTDSTKLKKIMLGNPFHKKFQLSDMFFKNSANNGNKFYPMTDTAATHNGDFVEHVVYAHDSSDVSNDPLQYIAITPETPGFGDIVEPMIGFWLKLKPENNLGNNFILYPLEN